LPKEADGCAFNQALKGYEVFFNPDLNYIEFDNIGNIDEWVFDDVLFSLNNDLLTNTLNTSGIFTINLGLNIKYGIKKLHNISIRCDGN
jgi:hypothetical protein